MGSPWTMAGTPTGPDGQAHSPRVPALQERTLFMPVYLVLRTLFTFEVFMAATNLSVFPVFPEHVTLESERSCIGCRPGLRWARPWSPGCEHQQPARFCQHLPPLTLNLQSFHFESTLFNVCFSPDTICKPVSFRSRAYPTNICYKTRLLVLLLYLLLCMLPYCYYLPPF